MNIFLFKKILALSLVVIFLSTPLVVGAQNPPKPPKPPTGEDSAGADLNDVGGNFTNTAGTNANETFPRAILLDGNQTYQSSAYQNSQANGQNQTTQGQFGANGSVASQSFASCSIGGALGNFVKNQISGFIGSALNIFEVPVGDNIVRGKEVGVLGISWDQLGWCLVNFIIESIGAATVAWINGGFQGNPVFVEDPEQFFADIADIQAGAFLGELSNGFLCSPIQNIVRVNLAQSYNSQFSPYGACTFTAVSGNLESFMSGQSGFNWVDWQSYTQEPYNNPFGATLGGQIQLDQRISSALGLQTNQLDWGAGFLSSRDPVTGKITSPGSVIEKQVNERLGSGQRRLEIADEFDEIVNALVNQLIKVAISEMTQQ